MTTTLDDIAAAGVIAVLRAPAPDVALSAIAALVRGGITGVEVTYTTPGASQIIRAALEQWPSEIVVGAGTLTEAGQVGDATAAGAEFLVSPGARPALAAEMISTGRPVMLGAFTPSEVMTALDLGATAIKLFPASLGGPALLRALRGPFPDVSWVPTGGVSPNNLDDWLHSGAVAVGAGSELCSPVAIRESRWNDIEQGAQRFRRALDSARGRGPVSPRRPGPS
jgi:2-dehydro-3-deoxyphosphogluconate aldolase/(4S)-4-hydroxy-2-oxoglutarate aldolase